MTSHLYIKDGFSQSFILMFLDFLQPYKVKSELYSLHILQDMVLVALLPCYKFNSNQCF